MNEARAVALVTGTSSGIGRATAALLAASNWRVFGTSRSGAINQQRVTTLQLDVREDASVQACIQRVLDEVGQVDLLVNNAGFALVGAAEEFSIAQAKALFETNLFGAMRVAQAVLPGMRAGHSGRIINVGSIAGFVPSPLMAFYAASKHALRGWSDSLDHEVRNFGIRALVVEPGVVRTNIDKAMMPPDRPLAVYEPLRRNVEATFEAETAKALDPSAVAAVILAAATAKRPRLHYPVGKDARLLRRLQRLLPSSMFDQGLRKHFHLADAD